MPAAAVYDDLPPGFVLDSPPAGGDDLPPGFVLDTDLQGADAKAPPGLANNGTPDPLSPARRAPSPAPTFVIPPTAGEFEALDRRLGVGAEAQPAGPVGNLAPAPVVRNPIPSLPPGFVLDEIPAPVGPVSDIQPLPRRPAEARDESRGFLSNLISSPREFRQRVREDSAVGGVAKFLTGNTDAQRAARARGGHRVDPDDPIERELNAALEPAYQRGGYDDPEYRQLAQSLAAYREARDNPKFDLGALREVFAADPGGTAAEFLNYLAIDPYLLATPLGWERAAALTANLAKARGASEAVVKAARAAGGATGAAALGAAIQAPVSAAQQLGESGRVDFGRTARETALAAGGSALFAGAIQAPGALIAAERAALARAAQAGGEVFTGARGEVSDVLARGRASDPARADTSVLDDLPELDGRPVSGERFDAPPRSLDEVYGRGDAVKPGFDAGVRAIADQVGGRAVIADLKDAGRATDKVTADYAGDVTKLRDVVRATIEVSTIDDVGRAIASARARFGEPDPDWRNAFAPGAAPSAPDGYRDAKLVFRVRGQPVELQVNLPEMIAAKKKAHSLYEQEQVIVRQSEVENRGPTAEELQKRNALREQRSTIYADAWERATRRLNADSSTTVPLRSNETEGNLRGSGLSQAQGKSPGTSATGTPSTSANIVPGGNLSGSGIVEPSTAIIAPRGREAGITEVFAEDGRYHPARWDVVEADAVAAAIEKGQAQFRDRTRAASEIQIEGIAKTPDYRRLRDSPEIDRGAPVLSSGGLVIAGNGRIEGLRRAYARGAAGDYRARLEADVAGKGIDPPRLAGMRQPVLVRVLTDSGEDVSALAAVSNEGGALRMSALEQSRVDAERIGDIGELRLREDGTLTRADNAGLVQRLLAATPQNQHGALIAADGELSAEGLARVRNAVLYRAYGDTETLSRLVESTGEAQRNVANALLRAAPSLARMRDEIGAGRLHDADITSDLLQAVDHYARLRNAGRTLDELLAQDDFFGRRISPEAIEIIRLFEARARSARAIADALIRYTDELTAFGDPNQADVFGARAAPARNDLLRRAIGDERDRTAGTDTAREGGPVELREGTGREPDQARGTARGTDSEPVIRPHTPDDLIRRDRERAEVERRTAESEKELESRQKADRERDDFQLTGSERPADANPRQGEFDFRLRDDDGSETGVRPESRESGAAEPGPGSTRPRDVAGSGAVQLDLFTPREAGAASAGRVLRALGTRVRETQTGTFRSALTRLETAADVAHAVAPLRREAQEVFLAVVTDANDRLVGVARLFKGHKSGVPIDLSTVMSTAHHFPGGRYVWSVHQHPSGSPRHSAADLNLYAKFRDIFSGTGVHYRGSVVVSRNGEMSARTESGEGVPAPITPGIRNKTIPVTEGRLVGAQTDEAPVNEGTAAAVLERLSNGQEGVMLVGRQLQPLGFLPMTAAEMQKLRAGPGGAGARLFSAIRELNAQGMIARVRESFDSADAIGVRANLKGLERELNPADGTDPGLRLLDVFGDDDGGLARVVNTLDIRSTFFANPFYEAASAIARDIGVHTGRQAAASFAGGVFGATLSDDEVGSAKWWLDVGAGALAGSTASFFARGTQLLGKGSIADRTRAWLGEKINQIPYVGSGPREIRDLKARQRLMQQYIDRKVGEIGDTLLKDFTPSERGHMADLIETRGIIKDFNRVHIQAQALDDFLTRAAQKMKELKMLPADLEEGGYLHRYYSKHLGLDELGKQAKAQTLGGSYAIARGTNESFARDFLSPDLNKLADELDGAWRDLRKLEARPAALLVADDAKRAAELRARIKGISKLEVREYVGEQNGKLKSFFFLGDEVPRVPGGTQPPLVEPRGRLGAGTALDLPRTATGALRPTDRVWSLRQARGKEALLHRDWTEKERAQWGEITDAGYRFVRGMIEVSHDLSLATLWDRIARNPEWVSDTPQVTKGREWKPVPMSSVGKGSPLQKYGALAGKYVRPDVWNGIRGYGRSPLAGGPRIPFTQSRAGDVYLAALNRWKLWHTVYNPATHFNNTSNNLEMFEMAGYRARDQGGALLDLRRGEDSPVWREARDGGLFGSDWTSSLLRGEGGSRELMALAEKLRTQPEIPDMPIAMDTLMRVKEWWLNSTDSVRNAQGGYRTAIEAARAASVPAIAGLRVVKLPLDVVAGASRGLYRMEDNLFKLAVFSAERKRGASVADAVRAANDFFFDYNDLPAGVKLARDLPIGSPFISYTFKAVPAIARAAVQNPERVLALVAAYEAINYATLTAQGLEPGRYWEQDAAEQEVLPPWDKGRSLWGARNMLHVPSPDGYMLSVARAHALGNPFMNESGNRRLAVPGTAAFWGSDVFGSNPMHALLDIAGNEDWKGAEIYDKGAPPEEKARKAAAYLYQAWAPSNVITPGSYHQQRALEGLSNDARQQVDQDGLIPAVVETANETSNLLGMGPFTGEDRLGNTIVTRDALLGSFGVKLRPIRLDQMELFADLDEVKSRRDLDKWLQKKGRAFDDGRITKEQYDQALEFHAERSKEISDDRKEKFDATKFLRGTTAGQSGSNR